MSRKYTVLLSVFSKKAVIPHPNFAIEQQSPWHVQSRLTNGIGCGRGEATRLEGLSANKLCSELPRPFAVIRSLTRTLPVP